jgi:hypothetical protein
VTKPIDTQLAFFLREAPTSAKELARLLGKSESRMREILKQHQGEVLCKKNDAGVNVFWLPPTQDAAEAPPATEEPSAQVTEAEAPEASPTAPPADAMVVQSPCPLCNGVPAVQTPAGAEGTFLGAANTCGSCGKTYNRFTGEEVTMPAKADKPKRTPLNPQYKIRLKTDAAQAAGGKLLFDKEARQWVLTKKGKDPIRMTAKEFSVETAETITAKLA